MGSLSVDLGGPLAFAGLVHREDQRRRLRRELRGLDGRTINLPPEDAEIVGLRRPHPLFPRRLQEREPCHRDLEPPHVAGAKLDLSASGIGRAHLGHHRLLGSGRRGVDEAQEQRVPVRDGRHLREPRRIRGAVGGASHVERGALERGLQRAGAAHIRRDEVALVRRGSRGQPRRRALDQAPLAVGHSGAARPQVHEDLCALRLDILVLPLYAQTHRARGQGEDREHREPEQRQALACPRGGSPAGGARRDLAPANRREDSRRERRMHLGRDDEGRHAISLALGRAQTAPARGCARPAT